MLERLGMTLWCKAHDTFKQRIMHELLWITIFWSRVRWFADDFYGWWSHEWKSGKPHHQWQKIVIHSNKCIILFFTWHFMSRTHNSNKNNQPSLISPLSPRTVFSDLVLWPHQGWSMMSCTPEVLTFWGHISWFFLHVPIGARVIFTSEEQLWISSFHHPVSRA